MTHLEAQWGQLIIQRNGKVTARLNCCACDDGVDPILMDYFKIEIAPTDDTQRTLDVGCNMLSDSGYNDVAEDTLTRIKAHCTNEHTDAVKLAYEEGNFNFHPGSPSGIHKETCFSQVEILPDGQIQLRLQKCVLKDGLLISKPVYHRMVLNPLMSDIPAYMATISTHLVSMGEGTVVSSDIDRIGATCGIENTSLCVARYRVVHETRNVETYSSAAMQLKSPGQLEAAQARLDTANSTLAGLVG
jgi:hypothetical protein